MGDVALPRDDPDAAIRVIYGKITTGSTTVQLNHPVGACTKPRSNIPNVPAERSHIHLGPIGRVFRVVAESMPLQCYMLEKETAVCKREDPDMRLAV